MDKETGKPLPHDPRGMPNVVDAEHYDMPCYKEQHFEWSPPPPAMKKRFDEQTKAASS